MDVQTTQTQTAQTPPPAAPEQTQQQTTTSVESLLKPTQETRPASQETQTVNGEVNIKEWMKDFPDDLKGHQSLSRYNDIQSLAKAYINAEKAIGKDKIVIPDQHATEEDWNKFYQKIGLPESPEKYDVKLKDAKFVDEAGLSELKPLAHKLGILPKQLEGILSWYEQRVGGQLEQVNQTSQAELAQQVDSLKKEWGQSFDTRVSWAKRLLDENKIEGIDELRNDPKFGSNPVVLKLLAKIGEQFYKEDTIRSGDGSGRFVLSPAEAQSRIDSIMGDTNHPYYNSEHPNHKTAVEEVQSLFDIVHYKPS